MTAFRSGLVRRFALVELLLQTQFWFPVWYLFLRDLGYGIGIIVLVDALFRLMVVLCEVPMGIVADRLGRRPAYLAFGVLTVVTYLSVANVDTTAMLVGAWLLWGVQWAAASGLGTAYLTEAVGRYQPDVGVLPALGVVRGAAGLAGCVSLASAGALYDLDPRLPFLVTAGCALVAVPLIATLPRTGAPESTASIRFSELREVQTDRVLQALLLCGGLVLFYGWSVTFLFQPLVLAEGMSEQAAAWMYAGFAATGIVGSLAAAPAYRRLGLSAVGVGFAAMVLAVTGAALASGVLAVLCVPVLGCCYYLSLTASEAAVAERAAASSRATALSLVSAAAGLGIAAARPALGIAGAEWGTGVALGAWAAVGVPLLLLLAWTVRRVSAESARVGCGA